MEHYIHLPTQKIERIYVFRFAPRKVDQGVITQTSKHIPFTPLTSTYIG